MGTARRKTTTANPRRVERFTLDSTQATNKEVFLTNIPSDFTSINLDIPYGSLQFLGDDYAYDSINNKVFWGGLALETVLSLNDKIIITYN